jgi:hypothetical protein
VAYHSPLGPDRMKDTLYKPATLSKNTGTLNQGLESTVQSALEKAIAGGGGLDVESMKAKHLDDTLAMRDNELQLTRDQMGAQGRLRGGTAAALEGDVRSKALESVLGGYRDINIEDKKLRNDNLYRGVEVGNSLLTGQSTRKLGDYAATLEGELGQEDLNLRASGNSRDNYIADLGGAAADAANKTSRANTGDQVAADRDRTRTGLLGDILNIMERARSGDQATGLGYSELMARIMGR